ncbi:IS66-like element accessory protein TnpA [Labrys okinawensis]|uniref:IS66-like element accessory protein TnpA n=1 Tax=Labrys okinawensis TaxID=346911 RepID=UPI0039BC3724
MQMEVLGRERRRQWRYEEKIRILEETMQTGAVVCDVARRHGVSQSLVFTWRRLAREGRLAGEVATGIVPVKITSTASPPPDEAGITPRPRRRSSIIEIDLGDGKCVRVDRDVNAEALRRLLDVLGAR